MHEKHRAGKPVVNETCFHFVHVLADGRELAVGPGDEVTLQEGERLVMLPAMQTAPWLPRIHGSGLNGAILRLVDQATIAFYERRGLVRNAEHLRELLRVRAGLNVCVEHCGALLNIMLDLGLISFIPDVPGVPLTTLQVGHA